MRHQSELAVGVVLARNEKRRDFEPHVGLRLQVLQSFKHRRQRAAADLVVETLGERLQIDVCGVHVVVEFGARLGAHVASGHGDAFDAARTACLRSIHRVLHEHDRIIVGERDACAAEPFGGVGEILGVRTVSQRVHLAGLRHIPVLAELAG